MDDAAGCHRVVQQQRRAARSAAHGEERPASSSKHFAERGRREQAALGALDVSRFSALPGIEALVAFARRDVDGVPHQPVRLGVRAGDEGRRR